MDIEWGTLSAVLCVGPVSVVFVDTKDTITAATAIVAACIGTAGFVLSILNYRSAASARRVRLRVATMRFKPISGGEQQIGIDVVNLSAFEVTISGVGFELSSGATIPFLNQWPSNFKLPYRLDPRRKCTFPFPTGVEHSRPFADVIHAYARCEDDEVGIGDTELLRQLVRNARSRYLAPTESPGE